MAGLGEVGSAAYLGHAEVGEERVVAPARPHEDVVRLDVTMDQPELVGAIECVGDLGEDAKRPPCVELATHDQILERRSSDQLHRDEEAVVALPRLVHGDDVRVVHRALNPRLVAEALAEAGVGGQLGREQLERYLAVE